MRARKKTKDNFNFDHRWFYSDGDWIGVQSMISYIFVSIICINGSCDFMTSNTPVTETRCIEMKRTFLEAPFRPEVTMAAAQCMKFTGDKNI